MAKSPNGPCLDNLSQGLGVCLRYLKLLPNLDGRRGGDAVDVARSEAATARHDSYLQQIGLKHGKSANNRRHLEFTGSHRFRTGIVSCGKSTIAVSNTTSS
jgi:hypothetical protein